MARPAKAPILAYQFVEQNQVQHGFGYLVDCADGSVWCFPDEDKIGKPGGHVGAFQIDQSLIQPESDNGTDRRLYLYRGPPLAVRAAPKTPPVVLGYYQGN